MKIAPYAKGVYIVPNVVIPALLARAANRVRAVDREPTTSDANIQRRRWLLIDADPVRPAAISSTETEHAAGLQRVQDVSEALTASGWPDGARADSGNGGHLLYRLDLPNDDASRTLLEQVLQAMAPLQEAGRLGAVLIQFPYRFHHTPENRAMVERLADAFRDYPLVLEIRHRSWDRAEVFLWLQELGIGFCNIDQPQVSVWHRLDAGGHQSRGLSPLHGRNAAMWFAEETSAAARYDYRYSAEELQDLVDAVEVISRRARDTYLITNNHFRGQAALNALELKHGLRRSPIPVPPPLLAAYPESPAYRGAGIRGERLLM